MHVFDTNNENKIVLRKIEWNFKGNKNNFLNSYGSIKTLNLNDYCEESKRSPEKPSSPISYINSKLSQFKTNSEFLFDENIDLFDHPSFLRIFEVKEFDHCKYVVQE